MEIKNLHLDRREFVKSLAAVAAGSALRLPVLAQAQSFARKIKLGMDNFSVRAMGWKAGALIDYAARRLSILDRAAQANSAVRSCRKHWTIPYRSIKGDIIPIIPHFRFGNKQFLRQ